MKSQQHGAKAQKGHAAGGDINATNYNGPLHDANQKLTLLLPYCKESWKYQSQNGHPFQAGMSTSD
jgi:hypothetical protein